MIVVSIEEVNPSRLDNLPSWTPCAVEIEPVSVASWFNLTVWAASTLSNAPVAAANSALSTKSPPKEAVNDSMLANLATCASSLAFNEPLNVEKPVVSPIVIWEEPDTTESPSTCKNPKASTCADEETIPVPFVFAVALTSTLPPFLRMYILFSVVL